MWFFEKYYKAFAIVFIMYGCFKLALGLNNLLLSEAQRQNLRTQYPYIKALITTDTTIAGMAFDLVIVVFSLYTLSHGIYLLRTIRHKTFNSLMSSHTMTYVLYGLTGLFMIVFYSMIVYFGYIAEKLHITWKKDQVNTYKLMGIGTGVIFILSFILSYLYFNYRKVRRPEQYVLLFVILAMLYILYKIVIQTYDLIMSRYDMVATMLMIPLAAF